MLFHFKAAVSPAQNHRAHYSKIGSLSILILTATGGTAPADDRISVAGPAQLMGRVTADVDAGVTDIWSNNISDEGIKRTRLDHMKEVADWDAMREAYDWKDGREGTETAAMRSLFRNSVDAEFNTEKFDRARDLFATLLTMSDTAVDVDDIEPALINAVVDDPLAFRILLLYSEDYPAWASSRDGLSRFEAFERNAGELPNAIKEIIVAERIAEVLNGIQAQVERFNSLTVQLADPMAYQGALTKTGLGTLILQGIGTYTGETRIDAGLLVLDGQKAGQDGTGEIPSIASPVLINRHGAFQADGAVHALVTVNGLLNGTGTIGNLLAKSGGVVSPGNLVGTLNVNGNATFEQGSVIDIEIANDYASADRLAVADKATLLGGVVNIHLAGNVALLSEDDTKSLFLKSFDILTTGAGVTGQFEGVWPRYNYITPNLDYSDKNKVVLGFDFTPEVKTAKIVELEKQQAGREAELLAARIEAFLSPDFLAVGVKTHNQKSVWRGIQSLGAANEDLLAEVTVSTSDRTLDFDALSGEVHASLSDVLAADSHFIADAATSRVRNAFGGVTGKAQANTTIEVNPSIALWGEAYGSWAHADGNGNASGYSRNTGGLVTGFDGIVADDWRFGLLAGYGSTSLQTGYGKASVDSYQVGVYGGTKLDALGLRLGVNLGQHEIDTKRTARFGSLNNEHEASYDAQTVQVFGELGYEIVTPYATLEPFAAARHVHVRTNSFSEDGAVSNLSGEGSSTDLTITTLGLRASHQFTLSESTTLTARGMLGWTHGFGDVTPEASLALNSSAGFTVEGAGIAKDAAIIEAGFDIGIGRATTIGLSYTGQFSSQSHDNAIKADLNVRF
ncbi:autotransporter domain-containing protein [Phyllobacterium sp. SB3]|uniref:autotransporter outer membrane beta-barrel domain-containing protein n=1 Tax=Phyllobacterium sp. SB3 TaxID=3156073 RepID=UPI0032AF078B